MMDEFRAFVENIYQMAMGGQISWHEFNTRLIEAEQRFNGNEYVSCLCGHPLFRRVAGGETMQYYLYRSMRASRDSEPITRCPECRRVLDIGTTRGAILVGDRIQVVGGMNEGCMGTVEKIEDTFHGEPYWVRLDGKGVFCYRRDRLEKQPVWPAAKDTP